MNFDIHDFVDRQDMQIRYREEQEFCPFDYKTEKYGINNKRLVDKKQSKKFKFTLNTKNADC